MHHQDQPAGHDGVDAQVAEVTDYLVAVRGGAPFLSGADGRLLLAWLDAGVSVPAILAAIDGVAERRRRKRARSRLSLTACRRAVDKLVAAGADDQLSPSTDPVASATAPPAAGPLDSFLADLEAVEVPADLQDALDRLRAELRVLNGQALHADALGRAAARCLTAFHQEAWEAAAPRHPDLRARAEAQLAPMRRAIPAASFGDMVEEVARDLLRQELPAVSARRLWDSLGS